MKNDPKSALLSAKTAALKTPVSSPAQAAVLPFGRSNYLLMIAGLALIFGGYLIMTFDKAEFGFGFLGLTLGPLVTMAGFLLELVAILKKPVRDETK